MIPRVLRAAALLALIAFVAWRVDFSAITAHLRPQLGWALLAIQPLIAAGFLIAGLRLWILLATPDVPYAYAVKAVLLGSGANVVLPARLAEPLRAAYLRDLAGVPLSTGISAILLERVTDVALLGLSVALSVNLLFVEAGLLNVLLIAPAVILVLALPWLEHPLGRLCEHIPWAPLRAFGIRFVEHTAARVREKTVYLALACGTALWCVSVAAFALFLHLAGGSPIGLGGALAVFVMAMIGGAVPALPGGFGTFEAGVILALTGLGYGFEEALVIAVTLHASELVLSVLASLVIVSTERLGVSRLVNEALAVLRQR